MKIKELKKEIKNFRDNDEVIVAIFFKNLKYSEISDVDIICKNGGMQISVISEIKK